jgi:hypothetical protein
MLLRILTAVWGFWFAAAFLELPGVHVCAVHGSGAGPAGIHAHHHHESAPTKKGAQCTCLSQCCSTTPAAISTPPVAVEASTIELPAVEFRAPSLVVVAPRPYSRPFANGPPVA